jgi:hypothetical protein
VASDIVRTIAVKLIITTRANVKRLGVCHHFSLPWAVEKAHGSIDTLRICGRKDYLRHWTRNSLCELNIKKLIVDTGSASSSSTSQNVPFLNKHLGILGKLSTVPTTQGRGRATWFWVTENGEPLKWKWCGENWCCYGKLPHPQWAASQLSKRSGVDGLEGVR